MKRLSLVDALFLYMETPETPMHVASVTIFKPSSAAEEWRKAIEHELSLGLPWHDRLNIQNPQVSDPDAPIDPH